MSPSAADIPAQYKDPDGQWTGFAARARDHRLQHEARHRGPGAEAGERPRRRQVQEPRASCRSRNAGTALTHVVRALRDRRQGQDRRVARGAARERRAVHSGQRTRDAGSRRSRREAAPSVSPTRTTPTGRSSRGFRRRSSSPTRAPDDPGTPPHPEQRDADQGREAPRRGARRSSTTCSRPRSRRRSPRAGRRRSRAPERPAPAAREVDRGAQGHAGRLGRRRAHDRQPGRPSRQDVRGRSVRLRSPALPPGESRTATWVLLGILGLAIVLVVVRRVGAGADWGGGVRAGLATATILLVVFGFPFGVLIAEGLVVGRRR